MPGNRKRWTAWGLVLLLAAAFALGELVRRGPQATEPGGPARSGGTAEAGGPAETTTTALDRLYRERISGVVVEDAGTVERLLRDDREGSPHQRFILRLASGQTVLVSHNIDLAPRIEGLREGDTVTFRGEYEWNERGGVIHWTHHDPEGRRPGGWLRHGGRTYR